MVVENGSNDVIRRTEQNLGDKSMGAPIGEDWPPKNRIFGGYFDKRKIEKMTKNQYSSIPIILTSRDSIWWVQRCLKVFNAYLPQKVGIFTPKRSVLTQFLPANAANTNVTL